MRQLLFFLVLSLAVHNYALNPDKILCPVLAAMYNAGDMKVDNLGRIQVWDLKEALHKGVGCNPIFAEFQAVGVAAYAKEDVNETKRDRCFQIFSKCWWEKVWTGNVTDKSNRWLNIFTMNGHAYVEHAFSTGVRGGATNVPEREDVCKGIYPCEARFKKFYEPFANPQGRYYRSDLMSLVCYTLKHGDRGGEFSYASKVTSRTWQMQLAVGGWLTGFGRKDEQGKLYLTKEDVRRMVMDGQYPIGYQKRPWGCLFTSKEGCTEAEDRPAMEVIAGSLPCSADSWWDGTECPTTVTESCKLYCNTGNSTCLGTGGFSGRCTCNKGFCAVNGNACVPKVSKCQYFGEPCITVG